MENQVWVKVSLFLKEAEFAVKQENLHTPDKYGH